MNHPEFTTDKIPPQALEVERTVLASLFITPEAVPLVVSRLARDCFYATQNQKIFDCIKQMAARAIPVDVVSVGDELKKRGDFEAVGAEPYLSELIQNVATTANVEHHIKILIEKAKRRALICAAEEIKNQAFDGKAVEEIEAYLEALKGKVSDKVTFWHPEESRLLISRWLTTDPPAFQFVVPGLLSRGLVGFFYGEGGSYKSLAALWLCVQRAAGFVANSKWLDRFEIEGPAGRSMFCSVEDQEIDVHHRIRAIINRFAEMRPDVSRESIEAAVAENFHVFPRERWTRDGSEHIVDADGKPTVKVEAVEEYARNQGVDLIIFDTLSRISLVDENDNNAGARLVAVLEGIRDQTGATVLCVAHTGKAARSAKTDLHGQNGLRGASALMDNARFGLWFRALESNGGNPRLEVVNAKTFRARRVEPFKIMVDYPAFTLCEDADVEDDLMDAVVEDVRANPGTTQRGTRSRLKKNATKIKQAFRDADEEGLVVYKGKGKGYFPNV